MDVGVHGEDRTADTPISEAEFPLSNLLVVMGLDSFEAVIDASETTVLAVGRVRVVPGQRAGERVPHCVISGTLSVDYRVTDGVRFLQDLQVALPD